MRLSSETFGQILGDSVVYFTSDGGYRHAARAETCIKATLFRNGVDSNIDVTEISAMGAGFSFHEKLNVAEQVTLRLPRDDGSNLAVVCSVRHCEAAGDEFHIGVEYARVI